MKLAECMLSGVLSIFSFAVLALCSVIFYHAAYWGVYLVGRLFAVGPAMASTVALKLAFWVPVGLSIFLAFAFVMSTCDSMAHELVDEDGKRLFSAAIQRHKPRALSLFHLDRVSEIAKEAPMSTTVRRSNFTNSRQPECRRMNF
jgi:hypothetical protein